MNPLSPSAVVRHTDIDATLASDSVVGKRLLEPMKAIAAANNLPFKIIEDHQVPVSECEVHILEGDLWCCLEGSVRFVTGGTLVDPKHRPNADGTPNPNELVAETIEGGSETILEKGDWLWIPPGQPHLHTCEGTARLLIVKIPVAK
ncbi:MAG: hypothetical protein ABIO72_04625 [Patescibacteria group bacterium]